MATICQEVWTKSDPPTSSTNHAKGQCRKHRSQQQDHHTNRKKPPSRTADHIEVRALSWISQDQQARTARFLWLRCSTRTFSSSPPASSTKIKNCAYPLPM